MQVTLNIPDEVAARLEAKGVRIPSYVEEMLVKESQAPAHRPAPDAVSAAIESILERREGLTLNGLKIRDLIDEGRRY